MNVSVSGTCVFEATGFAGQLVVVQQSSAGSLIKFLAVRTEFIKNLTVAAKVNHNSGRSVSAHHVAATEFLQRRDS